MTSTCTDALNPSLFAAAHSAFGRVRVINYGQPMEGYHYTHPHTGRKDLKVLSWGEAYVTDCPFCNDTRERLWISHRYGIKDEETGWRGYELWKCYNEECQADRSNRDKLRSLLALYATLCRNGASVAVPRPVVRRDKPTLEPIEFPGVLVPLNKLPVGHPARLYLEEDREYDADDLAARWGVGYAEHVPARSRGCMSQGRIIIPVTQNGLTVGWQARHIGEADWKALGVGKYLTFFPKSLCLYGLDQAKDAHVLVLVEGVTSVWRYGPGACALLGKDLSPTQVKLLVEWAVKRTADMGKPPPLIVIPDTDDGGPSPDDDRPRKKTSYDAFAEHAATLKSEGYPGPIGIAPLPPNSDPAEMSRPRLRRLVAAVASVTVTSEDS